MLTGLPRHNPEIGQEHHHRRFVVGPLQDIHGLQVISAGAFVLGCVRPQAAEIGQCRPDPPFVAEPFLPLENLCIIAFHGLAPAAHGAHVGQIP
jgi:hypothetical protein